MRNTWSVPFRVKSFSRQFAGFALAITAAGCLVPPSSRKAPTPVHITAAPQFDPAAIGKIAVIVLPDSPDGGSRVPVRRIEDSFISALLGKGYSIAARSDVETVLREIHFQSSGLTDSDAAKLGKMLNVPAVLVIGVTEWRTTTNWNPNGSVNVTVATVGARLIGVESGEILLLGDASEGSLVDRQYQEDILIMAVDALARGLPARQQIKTESVPTPAGVANK